MVCGGDAGDTEAGDIHEKGEGEMNDGGGYFVLRIADVANLKVQMLNT